MPSYRRIVLASRPTGAASLSNFRLEEVQTPTLQPGQFLVRNEWLSLDPYMRGRMNEGKSYAAAQPVGVVMVGGTAGTVVESRHAQFKAGEKVVANLGWQEYGVSDGTGVYKADTRVVPLSAYLGAVGMPGVTAWYGLKKSHRTEGGRDGPGVRSHWRGRRGRRTTRQTRRLPRGRHRRRTREVHATRSSNSVSTPASTTSRRT